LELRSFLQRWYAKIARDLKASGWFEIAGEQAALVKRLPFAKDRRALANEFLEAGLDPLFSQLLVSDEMRTFKRILRKWNRVMFDLGAVHALNDIGFSATSSRLKTRRIVAKSVAESRSRSRFQPVGRWITVKKRLAIYLRDKFYCLATGEDLLGAHEQDITLDHIVPRNQGGTNEESNLYTCARLPNVGYWYQAGKIDAERLELIERQRQIPLDKYLVLADDILEGRRDLFEVVGDLRGSREIKSKATVPPVVFELADDEIIQSLEDSLGTVVRTTARGLLDDVQRIVRDEVFQQTPR